MLTRASTSAGMSQQVERQWATRKDSRPQRRKKQKQGVLWYVTDPSYCPIHKRTGHTRGESRWVMNNDWSKHWGRSR